MKTGKVVSIKNSEHYRWGQNCDGWHLLKEDNLSVIEERMEPGSFEQLHFHKIAQQLFYVLAGVASFEINHQSIQLSAGDSIHVAPGIAHKVANKGNADLRFIVISSPKSHGDRIDL